MDKPLENIFDTKFSENIQNAGIAIVHFAKGLDFSATSGDKLGKTTETNTNLFTQFSTALDDVRKQLPTLQEQMKGVAKQLGDGITNGFTDAITGTKKFSDAMKDMARSVVNSLIKMMVQYYITQPLFEALKTGFGMAGGGGGSPSGKAIGGSVQAGQPYMVGERGQEMFVPNQSGSIIPNDKLGGGSGVVVNQTINVSTGVQQTVRAEITNLMPQIQEATKSAVADARARGGSYSKALLGV